MESLTCDWLQTNIVLQHPDGDEVSRVLNEDEVFRRDEQGGQEVQGLSGPSTHHHCVAGGREGGEGGREGGEGGMGGREGREGGFT